MTRHAILLFVACAVLVPVQALADTECNDMYMPADPSCHNTAIHCDDIDRICNGAPACPPPPPEPCPYTTDPDGSTHAAVPWSWKIIREHWTRTSSTNDSGNLCGVEFKGDEDFIFQNSPPFAVRSPYGDLGQATVDLTAGIQYKWQSPLYNAVVATDDHPLELQFQVGTGIQGAFHGAYDVGVMEVFLDTGVPNLNRSPMDYILVGLPNGSGCINCNSSCMPGMSSVQSAWPFVCQTYEERQEEPYCPPLQTTVRTAIAVGMNALLDTNPCHCELGANQWPTNPYLSLFDGLKWRVLRGPGSPGPSGENAVWTTTSPGNYFVIGRKLNHVKMTIRANTIDIWMRARHTPIGTSEVDVTSTVTGLKRLYLGKFNKIHGGSSIGCELSTTTYSCEGRNRHCIHPTYDTCDGSPKTRWGARWLDFDDVGITGGLPDGVDGACCLPGGGCAFGSPADCAAAEGVMAGPNIACEPNPCHGACCLPTAECIDTSFDACPGTFQGMTTDCATSFCPCPTPSVDADADGDVDQVDFAALQRCFYPVEFGPPETRCICFDRPEVGFPEGDGDVDMDDVASFEACASGPGVPTVCQ